MWAVTIEQPGVPAVLGWSEVDDPVAGTGEVVIAIAAAALNRADLLQAAGHYPPPPGASSILGMECSGTISEIGPDVTGWQVGDEVCALLAGGGYAQRVSVPAVQLLPIPPGVDLLHAAALPEVACTVWSNLVLTAGLRTGQSLLIHGGASGIGTMAIQVAKALGVTVAVTASRRAALEACRDLGADVLIDYTAEDFVEAARSATGGRGVDVILDVVGAKYLARNIAALADGGRLVIIGMLGGSTAELDINALMRRRAGVISTALRSRRVRGPGSKAEIVAAVTEHLWPLIAAGTVRPVVDSVLDMREAGAAQRRLAAGGHVGKILLQVPPDSDAETAEAAVADPADGSTAPTATDESER